MYVLLQRHENGGETSRGTLCSQVCVRLEEGSTDTYEKIKKAFGNDSVSRAQVLLWHRNFVNGRETASTNVYHVRAFTRQDRLSQLE
jgi:hypothetical protein